MLIFTIIKFYLKFPPLIIKYAEHMVGLNQTRNVFFLISTMGQCIARASLMDLVINLGAQQKWIVMKITFWVNGVIAT